MAQELRQITAEKQTQQLAAMQIAVAKLVELPVTDLAQRVRDEMLDNAALEEYDPDAPRDDDEPGTADDAHDDTADEEHAEHDDELADYLTPDDVPAYLQERHDNREQAYETPLTEGASFYDELKRQMGEHNLTEREQEVMEYLIGSLDDDGFLRKDAATLCDELAVYHNVMTTPEEVERLLQVLQGFEPRGIGARSVQECLLLQLNDPDDHSPYTPLARQVLERCYKDFVGHRWDTIRQRLKLDAETWGHVLHRLQHLNPKPGSALGGADGAAVPVAVPDFYVTVTPDGEATVTLNRGEVPQVKVSASFTDTLRQLGAARRTLTREQKEAYVYSKNRVEAALSFINLINRRNQTLLAVMRAIVAFQRPFFDDDDEMLLRPLTLKEVAARAGVDISTVSRVTNSKFVETRYGIYPLRHFFSSQFTSTDGEEVSARLVKSTLRRLIDQEDKRHPLSDEALMDALKEEGLTVARRTVAKYRDMMGLPTARLRRTDGA